MRAPGKGADVLYAHCVLRRPLRGPRDKYSHLWEETNDTNLRRVSYSGIQCRPLRGPQDKYSLAVSFRLRREETNDTNIIEPDKASSINVETSGRCGLSEISSLRL